MTSIGSLSSTCWSLACWWRCQCNWTSSSLCRPYAIRWNLHGHVPPLQSLIMYLSTITETFADVNQSVFNRILCSMEIALPSLSYMYVIELLFRRYIISFCPQRDLLRHPRARCTLSIIWRTIMSKVWHGMLRIIYGGPNNLIVGSLFHIIACRNVFYLQFRLWSLLSLCHTNSNHKMSYFTQEKRGTAAFSFAHLAAISWFIRLGLTMAYHNTLTWSDIRG